MYYIKKPSVVNTRRVFDELYMNYIFFIIYHSVLPLLDPVNGYSGNCSKQNCSSRDCGYD
jgi:hypothetical protein